MTEQLEMTHTNSDRRGCCLFVIPFLIAKGIGNALFTARLNRDLNQAANSIEKGQVAAFKQVQSEFGTDIAPSQRDRYGKLVNQEWEGEDRKKDYRDAARSK